MEKKRHGVLILDGKDLTQSEGIAVRQGAFANLLAYPKLSDPDCNQWWEGDGYEWDLSAPTLAPRSVSLPLIHRYRYFGELTALFGGKAVHTFEFPDLKRSFNLRYTGVSDFHVAYPAFSVATLSLVEDKPDQSREEGATSGTPLNLSAYGAQVLEGTLSDSGAPLPTKQNLALPLASGGQRYDDKVVNYAPREATLHCLMTARSIEDFNAKHQALLHHLQEPGMRTITLDGIGICSAFYRSCSSVSFYFDPAPIWWRFDLTFTINSRN